MPPKSAHSQKAKRGSNGGTTKIPPKPPSTPKTDIKGFFPQSQSQDQLEGSIIAEMNTESPARNTELRSNVRSEAYTPLVTMDHERLEQNLTWDMQAYIKSLPTREDMDKYVYRLEASYKEEMQTMRSSLVDVQNKIVATDSRLDIIDHKIILLEEKNNEVDQQLKHLINVSDDLENRSRHNNIRIGGLPESVGMGGLKVALQGIFNDLLKRPKTADLEIDSRS